MKRHPKLSIAGFTLVEMIVALGAGSLILGAITTSSVSLQKSFNATDTFFSTSMQQIRIIDYLSRDARRAYVVTASSDLQTVTCIIPKYFSGSARTTPSVVTTTHGTYVSYPKSRSVVDAVTTSASTTLTSASAAFTASDIGVSVAGVNIPAGATIASVTNSTTAVMSAAATASTSSATVTFNADTVVYAISGASIVRTENGSVTNIASSTNSMLPNTTDTELANTECTTTVVTFKPIFTKTNVLYDNSTAGLSSAEKGTRIFSTTYLRNKRRG